MASICKVAWSYNEQQMRSLNTQVWERSISFPIGLALLLFTPAGTIRYWQAWIYLIIFFASSAAITVYLMKNDPALLARRMRTGHEQRKRKFRKSLCYSL